MQIFQKFKAFSVGKQQPWRIFSKKDYIKFKLLTFLLKFYIKSTNFGGFSRAICDSRYRSLVGCLCNSFHPSTSWTSLLHFDAVHPRVTLLLHHQAQSRGC
ncbi:unnamed protein product [Callosobruchus maculatus]|uniref:Uncharacterized protein n=1 Tax=Callosobruchus maculatus TaxID=64391 RepID=A0A653CZH0_CALMS|nr:unnamed protein product [Callosobruchus maculatus]